MRNSAKTLLLFAAFLGAAALALLSERPWERRDPQAKRVALHAALDRAKVTRIEVRDADGVLTVLEKKGAGWTVTRDGRTLPASPEAMKRAVDNLEVLNRGIVVSRDRARHAAFELGDAEALRVTVAEGPGTKTEFLLGKQGADVFSGYVRKAGSDEVLMVPGYLVPTYRKELKDWRDLGLVKFDPATAVSVEIAGPDGGVTLSRGDRGGWSVVDPPGRSDPQAVDALLGILENLKGVDAVDEPPAATGLDRPALTVTVSTKDGGRTGFVVGDLARGTTHRYARGLDGGAVLLLGRTPFDGLDQGRKSLRGR